MPRRYTVTLRNITWGDSTCDQAGPIHAVDLPSRFRCVALASSEDAAVDAAMSAAIESTGYDILEVGESLVD
jgi:hypothetical protein